MYANLVHLVLLAPLEDVVRTLGLVGSDEVGEVDGGKGHHVDHHWLQLLLQVVVLKKKYTHARKKNGHKKKNISILVSQMCRREYTRFASDHSVVSKTRRKQGDGVVLFLVACLRHLTIDHASRFETEHRSYS